VCGQLQRANGNWKIQWDKMVSRYEQDIANMSQRLTEQTAEFEVRLLDVKRKNNEEEVSIQVKSSQQSFIPTSWEVML
jgi:hypothetical protein